MSAAIIRFNELQHLPRRTLIALAVKTSADIDAGADKRALLDRLFVAVMRKSVECPEQEAAL